MSVLFGSALLIEDEQSLAQALRIALKKLGISAMHASTLKEARGILGQSAPEFILLDRTLPDGDGIELCKDLRKSGFMGRILMLTAFGQTEDRVLGLNSGADDYLPKPFSWQELDARIRALARRQPLQPPPQAASASSADSPGATLWQKDEPRLRIHGPKGWVEMTPLEYKLVSHLINSSGAIVSRAELLKSVWGFSLLPKTRTVDHFLSRLRKLFEEDPEEPQHFLTIRGAGYRFVP